MGNMTDLKQDLGTPHWGESREMYLFHVKAPFSMNQSDKINSQSNMAVSKTGTDVATQSSSENDFPTCDAAAVLLLLCLTGILIGIKNGEYVEMFKTYKRQFLTLCLLW